MKVLNIFDVVRSYQRYGVWYCLWHYGRKNIWAIWVASRMTARGNGWKEHAERHYGQQ
jgi:hypothetical protein